MRTCKNTMGALVLAVLITVWMAMPSTSQAAAKKYLSLGTGNPGGTFYFLGAGFASVMNKYVPEVRVIAESTAASEENFHLIWRKKMDLAIIAAGSTIEYAVEKKMDLSGIRLFCMGHTSDRHWIVRKESPVKSVSDFRGRKVAVGSPGSGALLASRMELADIGLAFDDFKPAYLSFSESITAIKDQTVDVGCISAGYPVASILDLARQIPIRLIPYSEEEMKVLIKKRLHRVKVIIPKGTYLGINVDTVTRGTPNGLFCGRDLDEDLVYKLMKALYDHPKEMYAIHPQAQQWNLDNVFRGADFPTQYIPFHPGSIKYLKEKGVWKGKS